MEVTETARVPVHYALTKPKLSPLDMLTAKQSNPGMTGALRPRSFRQGFNVRLRYIGDGSEMRRVGKEDVLRLVGFGPVTVHDVARKLSISWAKAQSLLSELVGETKVVHERKGRMNIFRAHAPAHSIALSYPKWARAKSLSQLVDELDEYWEDVSAQDIVEAERGHY